MLTFLSAHLGTILAALCLAGIVAAVIRSMLHGRKAGKSSCGCGCKTCAMDGTCHKKTQ